MSTKTYWSIGAEKNYHVNMKMTNFSIYMPCTCCMLCTYNISLYTMQVSVRDPKPTAALIDFSIVCVILESTYVLDEVLG